MLALGLANLFALVTLVGPLLSVVRIGRPAFRAWHAAGLAVWAVVLPILADVLDSTSGSTRSTTIT